MIGSTSSCFFKIKTRDDTGSAINYLLNRIPDLRNRAQRIANKWNNQNPNELIEKIMAKEWILNSAMNRFQLNFKRNVGTVSELTDRYAQWV